MGRKRGRERMIAVGRQRDGRGQMQRMMERTMRRETHTVGHKKRLDRGTRGGDKREGEDSGKEMKEKKLIQTEE